MDTDEQVSKARKRSAAQASTIAAEPPRLHVVSAPPSDWSTKPWKPPEALDLPRCPRCRSRRVKAGRTHYSERDAGDADPGDTKGAVVESLRGYYCRCCGLRYTQGFKS